ncbi:MAG: VOC family protein [Candidatus Promineifilaceae bacterium]
MSTAYKPEGYNNVSPYLVVNGAEETIAFLSAVFDGQEIRRFPSETGGIMHAEVRVGDSVIMLADGVEQWPAFPAHVHVYVPDVDAAYQRALKAGAASVQEPQQKEDEDRRGGVLGPGGITWWMATKVD